MRKYYDLSVTSQGHIHKWSMGFIEDAWEMVAKSDKYRPLEIVVVNGYRIEAHEYRHHKEKFDKYLQREV